MWIIPQVLDTVIFIDKWNKRNITITSYSKVPAGMQSEDLARPVIEVSSFFDKEVVFEIYTFGEQIVVIPLWEDVLLRKAF